METPNIVADKRFNEPLDAGSVDGADFLDFISARIDGDWKIVRKGVWINCHNRKNVLPLQGWKIHLSSVPRDAKRVLETTAAYLIRSGVSFKFLADAKTLRMTNAKAWTRGGSGKFITIYPLDEAQFRRLLGELEPLTRDFRGPYVLSDKRYKDSSVLYYRYGGIRPNPRLQADGTVLSVLVAPDGREIEDERGPVYRLPEWVREPFPDSKDAEESGALNGGRYLVEKALQFSTTGGVYVAHDAVSGKKVVLKEARANVHNFSDDDDAAAMLRAEYELLRLIEDCGAAPKPIELFQEWEHFFLAEEYLDGYVPLRQYSAAGGVFLDPRPTREKVARYLKHDLDIVRKLAAIIDDLHARGVVWGDVSFNNVLVHPDTLDVRVIDLEGARAPGSAKNYRVVTAGFSDTSKKAGAQPAFADDYFGVGAVMLFLLTHVNGILELKPRAWTQILAEMTKDFGLPAEVSEVIANLLHEDPDMRPRPSAALAALSLSIGRIGEPGLEGAANLPGSELSEIVRETCRFIKTNADLRRNDRLFPADPLVYSTNPFGLAHGAAGVLYALNRIEGSVPSEWTDWLLKADAAGASNPPGLSQGLSGVAWTLLEIGRGAEAGALFAKTFDHPLLAASSNLYHGAAGWGMTNLLFWRRTGDSRYLDRARDAGDALVAAALSRDGGLCWPDQEGVVHYGLAYGAAGIGLFLLYLDRALGGGFEAAAVRALDHDLAQGVEIDGGGLSWRRTDESKNIVSPYWKNGSAGVGIAAVRFLRALKSPRYREIIDRIHVDCDRKYTLFPGRNDGLAGLGEFQLDAYLETGDEKFWKSAHKIAAGLKLFRIDEKEGAAFPGNGLSRVSCDLATGASGIALFLDRLARPRPADFLLDEVLK